MKWKVATTWYCTCDEHGGDSVAELEVCPLSLGRAVDEWLLQGEARSVTQEYMADGWSMFVHTGALYDNSDIHEYCSNEDAAIFYSANLYPADGGLHPTWSPLRPRLTRASYQRVAKWIGTHYFNNASQFLKCT